MTAFTVSCATTPRPLTINKPLPGGQEINYYRWWDQYDFAQDEWKLHPTLTLNLGLRYELPGNSMSSLIELNERVLAANPPPTPSFV